jgi:hypothetical protein
LFLSSRRDEIPQHWGHLRGKRFGNGFFTGGLMNKIVLTLLGPCLVWGSVILTQKDGEFRGSGHTQFYDFPVVLQTFQVQISDPDSAGVRDVRVVVPVAAITTKLGLRDLHMRWSMFDQEAYPEIEYVARTDAGLQPGPVQLAGTLTINGVQRPFELTVMLERRDGTYYADGDVVISLTDFELPLVRVGFIKVQDRVDLHFHLALPAP